MCSSAWRVDLCFRGALQESRTCELLIGATQELQLSLTGLIGALGVPQRSYGVPQRCPKGASDLLGALRGASEVP